MILFYTVCVFSGVAHDSLKFSEKVCSPEFCKYVSRFTCYIRCWVVCMIDEHIFKDEDEDLWHKGDKLRGVLYGRVGQVWKYLCYVCYCTGVFCVSVARVC